MCSKKYHDSHYNEMQHSDKLSGSSIRIVTENIFNHALFCSSRKNNNTNEIIKLRIRQILDYQGTKFFLRSCTIESHSFQFYPFFDHGLFLESYDVFQNPNLKKKKCVALIVSAVELFYIF